MGGCIGTFSFGRLLECLILSTKILNDTIANHFCQFIKLFYQHLDLILLLFGQFLVPRIFMLSIAVNDGKQKIVNF